LKTIKDIVIIGSGNVATNLALNLVQKNYNVSFVFSPNAEHAKQIASKINASYSNLLEEIPQADLYIVAIKDDAILSFIEKWNPDKDVFVVHTSGSFQTELLSPFLDKPASFYPLQTFIKDQPISMEQVPILIEGTDEQYVALKAIANQLSNNVQRFDAQKRKALHIAAVSVNNFTNYLLAKTKIYCLENDLDFDLLTPLLKQTIDKCSATLLPMSVQTGPARRGDQNVIDDHIKHLENTPELQELDKTFSKLIFQEFHKNEL